jgi:hypothetical protein
MTEAQGSEIINILNNIYNVMLFNSYYNQIYLAVIFGAIIAIVLVLAFRGIN